MSKDRGKRKTLDDMIEGIRRREVKINTPKIRLLNVIDLDTVMKVPDSTTRFKILSTCVPVEMPEEIRLFVDYELERIRRGSLEE